MQDANGPLKGGSVLGLAGLPDGLLATICDTGLVAVWRWRAV